jgi:hypothetical protein
MTQVATYQHLNLSQEFVGLACQAIDDQHSGA